MDRYQIYQGEASISNDEAAVDINIIEGVKRLLETSWLERRDRPSMAMLYRRALVRPSYGG